MLTNLLVWHCVLDYASTCGLDVLCRRVEPLRCPPQPRMLRRFCAWDLESLHEFKLIQVNPSQSSSQLHIKFVRPFFSKSAFLCAFSFYACSFSSFSSLFFSLRMFQYYLFHPIFTSGFDQKNNCCFIFELKNVFLF